MTREKHYCETADNCKNMQMVQNIVIAIIVIYCVSIAACCVWGCFKRHYVREQMEKIRRESVAFDERRRNEGGGVMGAIIQAGHDVVHALK
jgi:hypothetical protein